MQSVVFVSLALLFVVIKADNRTASYISAHDFLFISGWPQSGTSLLQQILSVSPASSTLVEKCSQYIKRSSCVNWNYEGQWALKFFPGDRARSATNAVSLLNAGSMCQGTSKYQERILNDQSPKQRREKSSTYLHDAVYHITQTWGTMWNLEKKLLVEKSPQSMLKTAFLREVFKEANSIKFLIVLKHPATLNVALPKGLDWTTRKEYGPILATNRSQAMQKLLRIVPLSVEEMEENAKFFINFMNGKQTGGGSKCKMGWLVAMHALRQNLLRSAQANITGDTKLVRYEDFSKPLTTCKSLFRFIHETNNTAFNEAELEVCQKHFSVKISQKRKEDSQGVDISSNQSDSSNELPSSKKRQGPHRHNKKQPIVPPSMTDHPHRRLPSAINSSSSTSKEHTQERQHTQERHRENEPSSVTRRKLRLKWTTMTNYNESPANTVEFQPKVHKSSTTGRLKHYQTAYKAMSPAIKRELDEINRKLKFFGYSLEEKNELWDAKSVSAFDPWVLKTDP